ncbi:MAG: hypothetical protein GC154_10555 [bacterium]|nr:hypothetical protein [bacterium]
MQFSLFFFFLSLFSLTSFSQSENEPFQPVVLQSKFSVASYLNEIQLNGQRVFYIDFEDDSSAWVASSNGLFYFNGYDWSHFTEDDGLPSSMVRCVCVTSDGRVWIGTDQGAGEFDPSEKKFYTHGSQTGLAGQSVRRIHQAADGGL